jgi:cell division protein FtsL
MNATEYGLKQVVRNNTIVREVDEARQREMWQWVCIGVVLVLVLIVSVGEHFYFVQHGYRMQELQRQRAAEEEANRRQRLAIETLRSPKRIQSKAIGELRMVEPGQGQAIVIDRVVPADHPPASVVAARH